jgi:hypothetical protein
MAEYITSKPRGKYARRLWFFYEWLTGTTLPIDDLSTGGYINLLDPDEYYTISNPQPVRRQRVNENLLGNVHFCPMIRRTDFLCALEKADLHERYKKMIAGYPPSLLKRAMSYLYTKETKSSFEMERVKPDSTRTERFISLLQSAEKEDYCEKTRLIGLQNRIVDSRLQDSDYRTVQNYIGERVSWSTEKIHYVCPKPDDLPELMAGLTASHQRMGQGGVSAVIHAAAVSYGFVFLHPFEDGNGRIHRFLIHNILAHRGFTPSGMIFPVSSSMLRNLVDYDVTLEAFSRPLMELVEYRLEDDGRMTVKNETAHWYRYIDLTFQAESLFRFIERTIETEFVNELTFLANYDRTKSAIQEIVDMPDRKIDLFIQSCIQNNGSLSARKRRSHFEFLTEQEIADMENVIQSAYGKNETLM